MTLIAFVWLAVTNATGLPLEMLMEAAFAVGALEASAIELFLTKIGK